METVLEYFQAENHFFQDMEDTAVDSTLNFTR